MIPTISAMHMFFLQVEVIEDDFVVVVWLVFEFEYLAGNALAVMPFETFFSRKSKQLQRIGQQVSDLSPLFFFPTGLCVIYANN